MKLILAAALLSVTLIAQAATATLVRQTTGRSVTGQAILVCTYRYGNQEFDRAIPIGGMCPMSIQIQ